MTVTPSRSPLGAFVRSPLGVRGQLGGNVDVWHAFGLTRINSATGGGYSFSPIGVIGFGSSLGIHFVRDPRNVSREIVEYPATAGAGTHWYLGWTYCGYKDGVWVVMGLRRRGFGAETFTHRILTSSNRKDWVLRYESENVSSSDYQLSRFAVTPSGFFAWFQSGYPAWRVLFSENGDEWSDHAAPYLRGATYNPVTERFTVNRSDFDSGNKWVEQSTDLQNWSYYDSGTVRPWDYAYDGQIAIGIGDAVEAFSFFPDIIFYTKLSKEIYLSTDGISWNLSYTHTTDLYFCACGGGELVAGNSSSLLYSDDAGATWVNADQSEVTFIVDGSPRLAAASYHKGVFVLYGLFLRIADNYESTVAILQNGKVKIIEWDTQAFLPTSPP